MEEQGRAGALRARGRLLARPGPLEAPATAGLQPLGLGGDRDGLRYVPEGHDAARPAPLLVLLHGAGGGAGAGLAPLLPLAEAAGLLLLMPESRGRTWDRIEGAFGPDVAFIDQALAQTFRCCSVDAARLAVGGFSDGASYALTLALGNGDLFTHALAFSPGFAAPARLVGQPRLYLAHGQQDQVLPIDRCSRALVPRLRRADYEVTYREFDGGHVIPLAIARGALAWLLGEPA